MSSMSANGTPFLAFKSISMAAAPLVPVPDSCFRLGGLRCADEAEFGDKNRSFCVTGASYVPAEAIATRPMGLENNREALP